MADQDSFSTAHPKRSHAGVNIESNSCRLNMLCTVLTVHWTPGKVVRHHKMICVTQHTLSSHKVCGTQSVRLQPHSISMFVASGLHLGQSWTMDAPFSGQRGIKQAAGHPHMVIRD
eukprot:1151711-Pelagomonas_calceolata.AAC.3